MTAYDFKHTLTIAYLRYAFRTELPLTEPLNARNGYKFKGRNKALLMGISFFKPYPLNEWATLDQWNKMQRCVSPGERGTAITVYKTEQSENGEARRRPVRVTVYNLDQTKRMQNG